MPFTSKYRHVYGDCPKAEFHFRDVKKPYTSGDGWYAAANPKFFGVSKAGGGGPVYVHRHDQPGRLGDKLKTINVHTGKALDFKFHPFIDNIIGIGSEDCSVSVTQFPIEGLTEHITEATAILKGHTKKVNLMAWHPTANNILTSTSWDRTVKLWNVETRDCVTSYDSLEESPFSMEFNNDGSLLAVSTKSKNCQMFDPRAPEQVNTFNICGGSKTSKLFWVPTYNWIGATCFNKQAKRELRLWDLKDTSKELFSYVIDQASSVLMPHYDPDTRMLYFAGKGEGQVSYSELVNDKRFIYQLGAYRDTAPQKGGCFVPKRALDTTKCEVARFLRLNQDSVVPVSFVVPRKTGKDIFQADIYPDTKSGLPSMSADEYIAGANKDPVMCSMDPDKRGDENEEKQVELVKKMSYAELSAENEKLKARIEELEKQLSA